jgi:branched-chain amino acid transport system substrate-binding protein
MESAGRRHRGLTVAASSRTRPAVLALATVLTLLTVTALVAAPVSLAQDQVIRFGASLSLTGRFVENARLTKDGYDFYVKHINQRGGIELAGVKHKVEIKYYDDQSDTTTATKLVEKLIVEDKVKFLLGPYSSTMTLPVTKVNERYRIPMVVAHAASTPIFEQGNKYLFGTLNTVDQYFENVLRMAAEATPRPRTVAIINENALFPQLSADAAVKVAKQLGMEIVYNEKYPTGIKDLSSLLAVIRNAKPDILLGSGYIGDMILLARQANDLAVKPPLFGMALGPTHPRFVESLGKIADGIVEPVQWAPNMPWKDEIFGWTAREYADIFKREYGYEPDYHPPQSTAALQVFHRAIQKAGSLDPEKVRDAIVATNIMTAYGPVKFDQRGVNVGKRMAVIQLQDGRPLVVYPADAAEKKLIYPIYPR